MNKFLLFYIIHNIKIIKINSIYEYLLIFINLFHNLKLNKHSKLLNKK